MSNTTTTTSENELLIDLREETIRISRMLEHPSVDVEFVDGILLRVEALSHQLLCVHENGLAPTVVTGEVVAIVFRVLRILNDARTKLVQDTIRLRMNGCNPDTVSISGEDMGRPRFEVLREQLVYLIENGFSCVQISEMTGVSLRIVRRRMSEYGLSIRQTYTSIGEDELIQLLRSHLENFPTCGYRLADGWLRQKRYRIQESRIREAMRRIDPLGVASRWLTTIQRRTYSVCGPQALWHLDGNHKLIR